jgi:MFS family permease
MLADSISEGRIGRAFSVHTFAGFVGGAIAPAILLGLTVYGGLEAAFTVAGLFGLVTAFALLLMPKPPIGEHRARLDRSGAKPRRAIGSVLTPSILAMTGFFTLLALANSAINSFSVVALIAAHGTSFAGANAALTAYLATSAVGVLLGGWLADRTSRHGNVTAVGFGLAAIIMLAVAVLVLPLSSLILAMGVAGLSYGMVQPSRDMLVRRAAPPGMAGSAFGIVSTGFNIGGIIGPPMFGWLMDHGSPRGVLAAAVAFMAITALVGMAEERRGRRAAAA